MQERSICNVCGADVTGNTVAHAKQHALAGEGGGDHSEWISVPTGNMIPVITGYKCSCGAVQ